MAQQQEQPSQVETWAYPFSLKNPGAQPPPEDYLRALSASEDGFYPLGSNGLWHGGIHFGQETAGRFDQEHGVRCIANGEVVAYRINARIQELTYPGGIKAGVLERIYARTASARVAKAAAAAYWINNRMYETADQGATEDDVDNITRTINPGLFKHSPGHPINPENMSDIVDRRSSFASIHNWEGLK